MLMGLSTLLKGITIWCEIIDKQLFNAGEDEV